MNEETDMERLQRFASERADRLVEQAEKDPAASATLDLAPPPGIVFDIEP